MERIGPIEEPYPPEVARDLEAMMPPGVEPLRLFRTLAHNPRVLGKIRASTSSTEAASSASTTSSAILRTCARCRSEYEWGIHVAVFARRFGIPDEKIAGTVQWKAQDARWSPHERAIVQLADELHDDARVSDDLWAELAGIFEAEQIVELLVLVGFYHTISFVTNGLAIAAEERSERFPVASSAA